MSFFGDARFDGEYYGSLMGGLEASEVMLSWIRENTYDFRMESEFYRKDDIKTLRKLQAMNHMTLGDGLASLITDGTHFTPKYVDEGLPFLSALNIKKGYIDFEAGCQHITQEQHNILCRRVRPREGDILMRKIGTGERLACVVPKLEHEFSIFVSIALIRANINPYYLSAFINSRYGQMQLLRFNKGINQPDLHLEDIRRLIVPLFSDEFYGRIEDITRRAMTARAASESSYALAQSILNDAIHFTPSPHSDSNTATVSFSQVFSSGRMDAEYFMPKYDDMLAQLKDCPTINDSCSIHGANFIPQKGTQYSYIELANVGTSGNITGSTIADGSELPTRARRIVHAGQVIISSIEGSMQSCALITPEYDGALCSTGFYVIDSDMYNPETLLLLFKSPAVQSLMKRGCSGTILSAISESELRKIPLPYIDTQTQQTISGHVKNSFNLRKESERLISLAVKSIETAIEYGENFRAVINEDIFTTK